MDWKPRTLRGDAINVEDRHYSGNYLRAMGIPLFAGRTFQEADTRSRQMVVLVNQEFCRQYLPEGNPVGRHLIGSRAQFEIIGVIGDVRGTTGSIAKPPGAEVYFLADGYLTDSSFAVPERFLAVRSTMPSDQLVQAIRKQVQRLDPLRAIRDVANLDKRLNEEVAEPRFNMGVVTSFALLATILASVGVYGVVSYSAAQRTTEIGIRMALGATRKQIAFSLVQRALFAALIGLASGGAAALFLTRLLRSQLYGVAPDHPPTFLASAALLVIPTLAASLSPALYAASINPAVALRTD